MIFMPFYAGIHVQRLMIESISRLFMILEPTLKWFKQFIDSCLFNANKFLMMMYPTMIFFSSETQPQIIFYVHSAYFIMDWSEFLKRNSQFMEKLKKETFLLNGMYIILFSIVPWKCTSIEPSCFSGLPSLLFHI